MLGFYVAYADEKLITVKDFEQALEATADAVNWFIIGITGNSASTCGHSLGVFEIPAYSLARERIKKHFKTRERGYAN